VYPNAAGMVAVASTACSDGLSAALRERQQFALNGAQAFHQTGKSPENKGAAGTKGGIVLAVAGGMQGLRKIFILVRAKPPALIKR
jgi:hypothetical protein